MTGRIQGSESAPRIMYSVPEAARQLSISRSTLFDLLRRHELVGVKVASRRLLCHDDLVDYANRLRNENAGDELIVGPGEPG